MMLRLTQSAKYLMIACGVAFFVQQTIDRFMGGNLLGWLALVPATVVMQGRIWQLVTYMFLHGDPMHLFLNLMMIAFIGSELEAAWGRARFLKFYFFCGVMAGLFYLLIQVFTSPASLGVPMVGASGAIYGLLVAYGIFFGERTLLFMMMFPMKAKHFIWVLAGIEFTTTVFSGPGGTIAGVAHLGGMAAGFGYLYVRARLMIANRDRAASGGPSTVAKKKKSRRAGRHLKLVIDNEKEFEGDKDDSDKKPPRTWH